MIPIHLNWIKEQVSGRYVAQQPLDKEEAEQIWIRDVSTDTRTLTPGALYVALEGDRFDGHDFLAEAAAKGARAALVQKVPKSDLAGSANSKMFYIEVSNTLAALGALARAVHHKVQPFTIALTGSSGKTTVKEMIAHILKYHYGAEKVLATQGNFNNDIGVPLTLLRLEAQHDYAVIELGANHSGEISYTASLCQPQVALINNISAAHVEGFGSLAGVATAKAEIFTAMPSQGIAIYPQDCDFAGYFESVLAEQEVPEAQQITFASQANFARKGAATLWVEAQQKQSLAGQTFTLGYRPAGEGTLMSDQVAPEIQQVRMELPLIGEHHQKNVLAATACCLSAGVPLARIAEALKQIKAVPGRLSVQSLAPNYWLLDDSYNANLGSTLAALEVLGQCSGERVFIFGDMGELGEQSHQYHQEIGLAAARLGIEKLWTLGHFTQATSAAYEQQMGQGGRAQSDWQALHFTHKKQLLEALAEAYLMPKNQTGRTFLVKGSRSMQMEEICHLFLAHFSSKIDNKNKKGESHVNLA